MGGGGAGGEGGGMMGGMMGGGMPDLSELMKGLPSMDELNSNMEQLKQMQDSLKSIGSGLAASPEERREAQEGLAQLLLQLLVQPTQEDRQASLVAYATSLANQKGDAETVAQAGTLTKPEITLEEMAATVALLVLPDPPEAPSE